MHARRERRLRAIRPRVSWQTPWLTDVPLRGRIPRSHACATRHIPLSFTFFPAVSLLVGILSALAASQPPLTQRRAACRTPSPHLAGRLALWPLSSIGSASSGETQHPESGASNSRRSRPEVDVREAYLSEICPRHVRSRCPRLYPLSSLTIFSQLAQSFITVYRSY